MKYVKRRIIKMLDFKALAEKNHDYVVEMRRYFHAHPLCSLGCMRPLVQ